MQAQRRMWRALAVRGRQECILMGIIINAHAIVHISLPTSIPGPRPGNWILMRINGHCICFITLPSPHTKERNNKIQNLFSMIANYWPHVLMMDVLSLHPVLQTDGMSAWHLPSTSVVSWEPANNCNKYSRTSTRNIFKIHTVDRMYLTFENALWDPK